MTLEEAIKDLEQEINKFEGLEKIHALTLVDYKYIGRIRQLEKWLKELEKRRKKDGQT